MAALVMVRSTCCESYKYCGSRCSMCPHRKENHEAVLQYRREAAKISFGRSGACPVADCAQADTCCVEVEAPVLVQVEALTR